jgi:hypothetical protein
MAPEKLVYTIAVSGRLGGAGTQVDRFVSGSAGTVRNHTDEYLRWRVGVQTA